MNFVGKKQILRTGFTVIEVVLVLAIAGLIFLMAFIGLPTLQRVQRDTQRRRDVGLVGSQILQWRTNNPRAKFQQLAGGSQSNSSALVTAGHPLAGYLRFDASQPEAPFQALSYNVKKVEIADKTTDGTIDKSYYLQFNMDDASRFGGIFVINGYGCADRVNTTERTFLGEDFDGTQIYASLQKVKFPEVDKSKFFVAMMLESGNLYCQDFN